MGHICRPSPQINIEPHLSIAAQLGLKLYKTQYISSTTNSNTLRNLA